MPAYVTGESADLFDAATGQWVGVLDKQGREQILVGPSSPFPSIPDSSTGNIGLVANLYETLGGAGATAAPVLHLAPTPAVPSTGIDCGAFWYQDFGLEYTRVNAPGSMVWYDWNWNHKTRAGAAYYPDRHPSLGWYQGDNANALSWQVKWMMEAGCTWAVLQQRVTTLDTGTWATASNLQHWLYQLYTNVPAVASGAFKTALWVPQSDSTGASALAPSNGNWSSVTAYTIGQTAINTAFDNRQYTALTNNTNKQPNSNPSDWAVRAIPSNWTGLATFCAGRATSIKTITRAGKTYAVVYFFEGEVCRSTWGSGTFRNWLQDLGAAFNTANAAWDGVAVLVRNSPAPSVCDGVAGTGVINYDTAETNRAFLLRADYNGTDASSGAAASYQGLIDAFPTFSATAKAEARQRRVYSISTSLKSVAPHPSTFNYPGHTPEKFAAFIAKARGEVTAGRGYPLLLINNVSEWAESGPGLQPNQQDGFGYLTALRNALR